MEVEIDKKKFWTSYGISILAEAVGIFIILASHGPIDVGMYILALLAAAVGTLLLALLVGLMMGGLSKKK